MASQLPEYGKTYQNVWSSNENCSLLLTRLVNGTISPDDPIIECGPVEYTVPQAVALGILLVLLTIGTAGGNLLIMLAIFLVRKLRSPTNLLIVNLALTDFLVSILVMPFATAYQLLGYWPFNQGICDLYNIFDVLLCTSSILSLCAISIDRYLAITRPLRYASKRSPKRMLFMILITWLLSAAISIPPVFGWEKKISPYYCGYSDDLSYQLYATFTAFYIPLAVMLVLYGKIFLLAKQMALVDAQKAGAVGPRSPSFVARSSDSEGPGAYGDQRGTSPCRRATDDRRPSSCSRQERPNNHGSLSYYTRQQYLSVAADSGAGDSQLQANNASNRPRTDSQCSRQPRTCLRNANNADRRASGLEKTHEDTGGSHSCSDKPSKWAKFSSGLPAYRKRQTTMRSFGKSETHKAVTTLGIIMGCFTICWFPFFFCQLITPIVNALQTTERFYFPPTLFQVFLWLVFSILEVATIFNSPIQWSLYIASYMNSFLNPIIYAQFNRDFRIPFIYILRCQCATINDRMRTESFAHQFGLPRKSDLGRRRSSTQRHSSSSTLKRARRQTISSRNTLLSQPAQTDTSLTGRTSICIAIEAGVFQPPSMDDTIDSAGVDSNAGARLLDAPSAPCFTYEFTSPPSPGPAGCDGAVVAEFDSVDNKVSGRPVFALNYDGGETEKAVPPLPPPPPPPPVSSPPARKVTETANGHRASSEGRTFSTANEELETAVGAATVELSRLPKNGAAAGDDTKTLKQFHWKKANDFKPTVRRLSNISPSQRTTL